MISVIIPVYNTVKYIDKCVLSVLMQTFLDWECLLIDDGSTDGSESRCDFWAKKDRRIRALHQTNKGVSAARNVGLDNARGDYVSFIDSDDWVDCDYLQQLYDILQNTDSEMSLVGFYYDYPDRSILNVSSVGIVTFNPTTLMALVDLNKHYLLYGPYAKLYKSTLIRCHGLRFDETRSYGEDLLFNYAYLEYCQKIANSPLCKYHYRQVEGSLSHRINPMMFSINYSLWLTEKSFFQHKNCWIEPVRQHLFLRLWGFIYDALFLFPRLDQQKYSYLKNILQTPEIVLLKDYANEFCCSAWIKNAIIHRRAWLFYLYFKLS